MPSSFCGSDLDLVFFAADVRDDVVENVERWHARIACAGERLHRDDADRAQAKRIMQRLECADQVRRRAVGVGDDVAAPPSRRLCTGMSAVWSGFTSGISSGTSASMRCADALEQTAKPAAARSASTARLRCPAARRRAAVRRGDRGQLSGHQRHVFDRGGHAATHQPSGCVPIALTDRTVGSGQHADLEPGMGGQSWMNRWPTAPVAPRIPTLSLL